MKLRSAATLAALIDQEKDARGLTQAQLAREAGVTPPFISHLLSGRKTSCTPETAAAIARALGVPRRILWLPTRSSVRGRSINDVQTRVPA